MANNKVLKRIIVSTTKIANIADLILSDEKHDLEIEEIHLTSKINAPNKKVVCKYYPDGNGGWVFKCVKEK